MSWRAATKALYEAGGGPLRRMDFWPPTIKGQDRGASLTRAAHLGLMERRNKGYVWRWELTPKGRDWCVGYMDASKHREPPSAGGPRVHEAPQGIGRG